MDILGQKSTKKNMAKLEIQQDRVLLAKVEKAMDWSGAE
jgi:hypothetical protein